MPCKPLRVPAAAIRLVGVALGAAALAALVPLAAAATPALPVPAAPEPASSEPAPPDGPDPAAEGGLLGRQAGGGGFLFGAPSLSIGLRGGLTFARADSDIFDFNEELLTLDEGDFRAGTFGLDVGWLMSPRLQALFGVEYSRSSPVSEFREFVDVFGAPIVQETRLEMAPLTASLKLFLVPRGRSVSRYAWVPNGVSPYVGAGAGFTWYRYQQFGDFVDFVDLTIFTDQFVSQGWATSAHLFGGTEVKLTPRMTLALEGRYLWADAELGPAFLGFEPIDLSGLRTTAGVVFYF